MKTITYRELADRLDNVFMFNQAAALDENIYDGLENGSLYPNDEDCEWFLNDGKPVKHWCCNTHMFESDIPEGEDHPEDCDWRNGEPAEIYQWYLIGPNDADYLKRHTDELVFYSNVLDEYVWGVTHFGTSWEGVDLGFYEDEAEKEATK